MFENDMTSQILKKELLPALEELARAEFGTYSMEGSIDEETVQWLKESKKRILKAISAYLDGLLEVHCRFGEELQKLRSDFNDSRN